MTLNEKAKAVLKVLVKKKQTLAVAESCTGGLLSTAITSISGASQVFSGGLVAYSNRTKQVVLKVPASTIKTHGAVSEIVAKKMASNARKILGTQWGIGITGIAGPKGGTATKPVGLVYIAVSGTKFVVVKKKIFKGSRKAVQRQSAITALKLLTQQIHNT